MSGTNRNLSYSYDELSRLTREGQQVGSSPAVTSTYVYDGVGNRSKMISLLPPNNKSGASSLTLTTTYSYNNADQMTSRSDSGSVTPFNAYTYNYNYDFNGSLTSETNAASGGESTNYSYDSRNRLTQVQKQAKGQNLSTATMQYDGKNTRLLMSYGGKATSYLQDGAAGLPVVLQEVVSGQTPSSFLYPRGSTSPLSQDNLWYHSDGLGSVRALTNGSTGAVVETNSYSAFGLNAGETGKAGNNHGFAGEQLDPTGLYFNRARYYNPTMGRFTTRDDFSITPKIPSSINRYIFVENDPTQLIDPSGYFSRPPNSVPRTPLCQSCGCRIDLVLDTAHLYIEFNDRCTDKKYMNEAFPSGDPQPGIFTAELALGFDSSVDIEDTAERGSNKSHHKLYETDTDKTTCDNIRSCLESQDVNQYDEIKRTFVWRNSKDYHYIDLEKPILLKHMITFAGIGFLNRGALGALVGGAIGVFTGTFDATFNINYHQNSNMAARLMVEKCITKFTGNKPSKEWWWIVPGWGLEFS